MYTSMSHRPDTTRQHSGLDMHSVRLAQC